MSNDAALCRANRLAAALASAAMLTVATSAHADEEWLSLGSKEWAPTVTSKSGIGTANATAEAKVTRKEIEGWCANWSPGDKGCVARELSRPETKLTYRASADCTRGRITPVDGSTYTLAGVWDNSDIGAGRARWRDASGKIVGRDNASNGLAISQQWELLCPGGVKAVQGGGGSSARAAPAPAPARAPAAAPAIGIAAFAVGQTIETRYGREWVRGKVAQVRQVSGPSGPAFEYDVRLDNGKRGIVPGTMVRSVPTP